MNTQPALANHVLNPDVIVIGSGIMSATLVTLLKTLAPDTSIQLYESTSELAQESSSGWSNAGTGHAGLCELSYTPHRSSDGSVDISKAVQIFAQFEQSLQFWAYAVRTGIIANPATFITPLPHISFVHGQQQVDFLAARHRAMAAHPFFTDLQFTADPAVIASWAPLLMAGRPPGPVAATRSLNGTDVNFGALARQLLAWFARQPNCGIAPSHRVTGLKRAGVGWQATVTNLTDHTRLQNTAKFVFIGAGGGSLPLLQLSGIPESKGLGGFPVGGRWLVCDNPAIVQQHHAKVYGQALGAAPTMAVPHLDTRLLDGRRTLLFGPFAAWTSRFLHATGSPLDLPRSVKPHNLATLVRIGASNLDLVRYLVAEGAQSHLERIAALRLFYPAANAADWRLIEAGIRVQAIKQSDGLAGIVHYGTELITDAGHTIAALLGASPGASVSVSIILDLLQRCFPTALDQAQDKLNEVLPAYEKDLALPQNASFATPLRAAIERTLHLSNR